VNEGILVTIETVLLPVSDSDGDRLNRLVDAALEIAAPTDAAVDLFRAASRAVATPPRGQRS